MTDLDFAGNRWKRSTNTRGEYWLPSNLRRHKLKPTRVIDHRFMLVLCRHRAGVSGLLARREQEESPLAIRQALQSHSRGHGRCPRHPNARLAEG